MDWLKDRLENYYSECDDFGETLWATVQLVLALAFVVAVVGTVVALTIMAWYVTASVAALIALLLLCAYAAHVRFVDRP